MEFAGCVKGKSKKGDYFQVTSSTKSFPWTEQCGFHMIKKRSHLWLCQ